jgi:glycosyltransferase involved in cell wall biosynthesis
MQSLLTTVLNPIPAPHNLPDAKNYLPGWPWLQQPQPFPATRVDGSPWSKITIVTPSYNQGQYLEATLRSVILQNYPNLEYIVIDGGSSDNSVEIIQKYAPWISFWQSEPDQGQSDAINKGLKLASGRWFNWLNSDDILQPNALFNLAKIAAQAPESKWISGGRLMLSATGDPIDQFMPWKTEPLILGLDYPAFFPQDATFFRLDWVREHNIEIRTDLHNVMDTFLYFQLMALERPVLTTAVFSAMRLHEAQKGGQLEKLQIEIGRDLEPLWRKTNPRGYFLHKLMFAKYGVGSMARLLLRLIMQYGLHPSLQDWQVAVFDVPEQQWKIVSPREIVGWV